LRPAPAGLMVTMTEDDLRRLVRESVARALGDRAASGGGAAGPARPPGSDPAHARFRLPGGDRGDGGACLIEPAVRCSHCGYCQSYGH
jgi:hypothetical protein